jgi:hypothetical protein
MPIRSLAMCTIAFGFFAVTASAQDAQSAPGPANVTATAPQPTRMEATPGTRDQQLGESSASAGSAFLAVSPLRLTAAIGGVLAMLGGLWSVFARLKAKNQGFGPNSLKALGLVLFVPTLLVIAVAVPEFNTQTLAALLGTVAGYVLSHSKPEDS